jgi:hypothetical protein
MQRKGLACTRQKGEEEKIVVHKTKGSKPEQVMRMGNGDSKMFSLKKRVRIFGHGHSLARTIVLFIALGLHPKRMMKSDDYGMECCIEELNMKNNIRGRSSCPH